MRLLLVKRMQAEHFTLAQVAHALRDASDDEVIDALLAPGRGRRVGEDRRPEG